MMITIRDMFVSGRDTLLNHDIMEADIDARYLLLHCLKISNAQYYLKFNEEASDEEVTQYTRAIELRASHYPLQYITKSASFMGMEFFVDEGVLIPRQDTETLVENAIDRIKKHYKDNESVSILDMCTGSGCIAVSIAKLSCNAKVDAADISNVAIDIAKRNAIANNVDVKFIESNLFENINQKYNVIVSNPPYIKSEIIDELMPEVKDYEPIIALDGMEDGLFFYKKIISEAKSYLYDGGELWFEIGHDQAQEVSKIFEQHGYSDIRVFKDMPGLDRVVCAKAL